jgi:hypothetical protein
MKYCEICGRIAEEHHVVFRSQAKYMVNVEINKRHLCSEHHRGNNSPHMNRKIDLKYKLELQKQLFEIFSKPFYNEKEIQDALEISEGETKAIVKTLKRYKEGYERTDLVIKCMGEKLYV